jgi:hypothetical protein
VSITVLPGERTGAEGRPISNRMLLAMNEKAFRAIRPRLKYIRLKSHSILHESKRKSDAVFFPDSGLISLVIVTSNGKTAEKKG